MSDVLDGQSGDNGDTGDQGDQAVTREQLEAMQKENTEVKKMLEELKKTQSGSDRTVTELQNLLKETKEKAEEAGKTEKQKFADRMTAIETKLAEETAAKQHAILVNLAMQLITDKGYEVPDEEYLGWLVGITAEETQTRVMKFLEREMKRDLDVADEFAKNNGRKVQKAKGTGDMKPIDEYSDDEINAMGTDEFLKIQERSKKKLTRS